MGKRLAPSPAELKYLAAAAKHRDRSTELVEGIELLIGKFRKLEVVPLDVLDRLEKAIVDCHVHNLSRLPQYYTAELTGEEEAA